MPSYCHIDTGSGKVHLLMLKELIGNKVWSTIGQVPCDLALTKIDLKINRVHLHPEMNVKFDNPSSILCQVII